jgi:hypothetical protein
MSNDRERNGHDAGPMARAIDRRALLAGAGGLAGLGTLGIPTGTAGAFAAAGRDPVSMAMHIHGSFSEGMASMDTHLDQARRIGVDVIWWTDHDFRLSGFGYRQAVGFDGPHEYDGPWDLTWNAPETTMLSPAAYAFVPGPRNPDESGGKLRVTGMSGGSSPWADYLVQGEAQNATYSTSYCDTTLVIDVRPETVSTNTQTIVEVVSSYRPARHGRPAGQYRIQYRVGDETGRHTEEDGLLGVVGIATEGADRWQRLTLDLRADHAALWPDTIADDACLWRLRLGVRARNGATATAYFDRLRFNRKRQTPSDGMAMLHDVIAKYRDRYPRITQYAATEVSLVMHLNAFGGDGKLPIYDQPNAAKDSTMSAQKAMVDWLHRHGATVSLNHPLQGTSGPDDLARRIVNSRGNGADVIEVGTDMTPNNLIKVFDIAARNAIFLTANGSTDDHKGNNWLGGRRWVTRVWSPTKRRGDLCAALEAGRAWFYDPLNWDGLLDLRVNGTTAMGGVLFTKHATFELTVRATALPKGSSVDIVVGKCDLAGVGHLAPVNRGRRVPARAFVGGRWSARIKRGGGVYVRAAITNRAGDLVGFSNPIWVLPVSRRDDIAVPPLRR